MALPTDPKVAEVLLTRGASPGIVEGGASGLLSGWAAFVDQVEAGYAFGLDDYRNDLDLRTLIAITELDDAAANDDARFRSLLAQTELEVWSSDAPGAWWTCGYPANSGPALLEDLHAEGIL